VAEAQRQIRRDGPLPVDDFVDRAPVDVQSGGDLALRQFQRLDEIFP
jgi:hypothetical protein